MYKSCRMPKRSIIVTYICNHYYAESSSEGDILNYMIYFGAGFGAILLIVIILLCVLIVTFALRRNNKKGRQDPCTSKQPHGKRV